MEVRYENGWAGRGWMLDPRMVLDPRELGLFQEIGVRSNIVEKL